MRSSSIRLLPLLLGLLLLTACSGGELVGIHVNLEKDGSGQFTTRALVAPKGEAASEGRSSGVQWASRAAVVSRQGRFTRIQDVTLGGTGLRFSAVGSEDRPSLRIYVQRAPDAEWVRSLVPDEATRRSLARVYDPTGKTSEIGDTIRLEITLPSDVVTSGVLPGGRGVEAAREGRRAYLLIPVRTALMAEEELVWDISWR